jgi:hypothetical protein
MKAALAVASWLWAGSVSAQSSTTLKGVDIYRAESVTAEKLVDFFGKKLETYAQLHGQTRPAAVRSAVRIKGEMEKAVSGMGDFVFVELFFGRYFTSAERAAYITFDVVERKDAAARMPFRPNPAGKAPDPGGLLADWQAYAALGSTLRAANTIPFDRPACPSYYCLWGSQTPELSAYEQRFVKGVAGQKKALLEVLAGDADPRRRAAAVYLLAYVPEGKSVADLMLKTLGDPAPGVRAAALQVLSDITVYHKDVFIDVIKLIPALDFPTVSDRSKALAVFVGLADRPDYRHALTNRAAPRILELLKQQQSSVHDLAYTVLGMLAKESFGRRDYKAWKDWLASQSGAAATAPVRP